VDFPLRPPFRGNFPASHVSLVVQYSYENSHVQEVNRKGVSQDVRVFSRLRLRHVPIQGPASPFLPHPRSFVRRFLSILNNAEPCLETHTGSVVQLCHHLFITTNVSIAVVKKCWRAVRAHFPKVQEYTCNILQPLSQLTRSSIILPICHGTPHLSTPYLGSSEKNSAPRSIEQTARS
jgi:hypothetical protein